MEEKLYQHVKTFIEKMQIECEEQIYQSEGIIDNAHDFIAGCCEIIGYYDKD